MFLATDDGGVAAEASVALPTVGMAVRTLQSDRYVVLVSGPLSPSSTQSRCISILATGVQGVIHGWLMSARQLLDRNKVALIRKS